MKLTDIAYIAGYIDADGSIFVIKDKPKKKGYHAHHHLYVTISSANKRVLRIIKELVGGGYLQKIKKEKIVRAKRDAFRLVLKAIKAKQLLEKTLPYLVVKRRQAELGIELQLTKRSGARKGEGWYERYVGDDIVARREEIRKEISFLNY